MASEMAEPRTEHPIQFSSVYIFKIFEFLELNRIYVKKISINRHNQFFIFNFNFSEYFVKNIYKFNIKM